MFKDIQKLFFKLRKRKRENYDRALPFGDYFVDRWEKAKYLGFGKGTSVYDNVVIIGDVKVGINTWIGPNVVLDGSGGLVIGNNCSISAGVQIYSDSINWAISGGKEQYSYAQTQVGNNSYIGPNTIIQKGIKIGNSVVIGANSFVNKNIPDKSKVFGNPVKIYDTS